MKHPISILVINCGSSSLKFAVIEPDSGASLVSGLAERLGSGEARFEVKGSGGLREVELGKGDHKAAIDAVLGLLPEVAGSAPALAGVGHRVVHGGERFSEAVLIDDSTLEGIAACATFAPLHNPANLVGIAATREIFHALPQVAVFDTAFHQTMAPAAFLYAVPYKLYEENGIRRYGFHGTSHAFVAAAAAEQLGAAQEAIGLVTLHLGNGCSACAVQGGKSVETSMGLSPLEGMAMGTRSGDVDPDLPRFLFEKFGMSHARISEMLNRESGLLGLSGLSHDMRTIVAAASAGNERAEIAIDVFVHRAVRSVFAMASVLDRLDAVVFTGGIGENSTLVRGRIAERLHLLGVHFSVERNKAKGANLGSFISTEDSPTACLVIPTNEELMIARQTAAVLG